MITTFLTAAPYAAILGPLAIFYAWLSLRDHSANRSRFLYTWFAILFAQACVGWLAGHLDPDDTRRALALLYSGTSWMLGPVLVQFVGRGPLLGGLALGTAFAPCGALASLLVAIGTGVINPC